MIIFCNLKIRWKQWFVKRGDSCTQWEPTRSERPFTVSSSPTTMSSTKRSHSKNDWMRTTVKKDGLLSLVPLRASEENTPASSRRPATT